MISTRKYKGYEIRTNGKTFDIVKGKYVVLRDIKSEMLCKNYIDTWDSFRVLR